MEEIVEITKSLRKNKKSEGKSLELIFPSLPVNSWKPLPEIPIERIGSGLNKKVRIYELLKIYRKSKIFDDCISN